MNEPIIKYKTNEHGVRHDFCFKHLTVSSIKILIGSLDKQYATLIDILSTVPEDVNFNFEYYNDQLKQVTYLINALTDYDKT